MIPKFYCINGNGSEECVVYCIHFDNGQKYIGSTTQVLKTYILTHRIVKLYPCPYKVEILLQEFKPSALRLREDEFIAMMALKIFKEDTNKDIVSPLSIQQIKRQYKTITNKEMPLLNEKCDNLPRFMNAFRRVLKAQGKNIIVLRNLA